MRVRTEIWVRAYLRRCQSEGIPIYVGRRGDEAAGAVFICVNRLDGTVALYGPAPAGLAGTETERRWVVCRLILRANGISIQTSGSSRSRTARDATSSAT